MLYTTDRFSFINTITWSLLPLSSFSETFYSYLSKHSRIHILRMSFDSIVQLRKWVPLEGTILETPLADVPYPPVLSTPVEDYGIPGLTQGILQGIGSLMNDLDEHAAFDINPWANLYDIEYHNIKKPERQLLLHLYEFVLSPLYFALI